MHAARRMIVLGVGAGIAALVVTAVSSPAQGRTSDSTYKENKLVADTAGAGAATVDSQLVNPWGLSAGPSSPLWVSDNGTDVSTVYSGGTNGGATTKVLSVATPGGAPTGQVFNDTTAFDVAGSPALFIFDGENGHITAWNSGAKAVVKVHRKTAVYKGLALVHSPFGPLLLAANFHAGTVDVFDGSFTRLHVGKLFTDPTLPDGYARSTSRCSARPST